MQPRPRQRWFDAHLDLAYLAVCGRDMDAASGETCGGPHPPAAVTLPLLRAGGVAACLGTIFTEAGGDQPEIAYQPGSAEGAHAAGLRQTRVYEAWEREGKIRLLRAARGGKASAPGRAERAGDEAGALAVGVLMECADPIRTPGELPWWVERGVVAIGLAWARPGRYAAGNATPSEEDGGLTGLGRELVREMDKLGVVHDVSHLSDRALEGLLEETNAAVMASHSNSREISGRGQRLLRDETVREIARRGGVIGLNLYAPFLVGRGAPEGARATIADCVAHIERLCEAAGTRSAVGLGSDMDGGFGAERLPDGIREPAGLPRLAEALHDAGWSDAEVHGFAWGNWARFWGGRTDLEREPRADAEGRIESGG